MDQSSCLFLPDCLHRVPYRMYWPSNLPLSCEVVENRSAVLGPNLLRGEGPKMFTAVCYRGLPSTMWQRLVEFCGMKCVCEGRQ